jgi:uncharacterized membrane protein
MQTPLHPQIVHFPIALIFILPILILVFAYLIRRNKLPANGWLIIIGLQLATTISGYIALETGETDEKIVQKVVSKKLIHAHEEKAEIFVGLTVLALVVSISAYFIQKHFQLYLQLGVFFLTITAAYLAYQTAQLGGELVYQHGASGAYPKRDQPMEGLLPTPGMNTSESPYPVDEQDVP